MANFLITGASGLVGKRLTEILLAQKHTVSWLGRSNKNVATVNSFVWDIEKQYIDPNAFNNIDHVIHLAGAGVADKKWTEERKKEIIDSRTKSSKLLIDFINTKPNTVKSLTSASAVGIYGSVTDNHVFSENTTANNDFFGACCYLWEAEVQKLKPNIALSILRIGIVLSNKGGALPKLSLPVKLFVGSGIGTGKQWMPWIHIDDLCQMFIHVNTKCLLGIYNAAAPNDNQVSNLSFVKTLAKVLKRSILLPNVPAFIITLLFGEMGTVVLNGSRVNTKKIIDTKFTYKFELLEYALQDLLK